MKFVKDGEMENSNSIFDGLNKSQIEAISTTEGFVRVIAGAGSGKTGTLTKRFAYLVNEIGVLPENILCVTFTNKASTEMRLRIKKLTNGNDTGYISTFHSFCVSVLQEDSNAVNYPKSFLVLDNTDINTMLQSIYDERGLSLRQMTFGSARDMIERRKLFVESDYYNDLIGMSLENIHLKYLSAKTVNDIIFYGYLYQEKKCFALDYNDLIKFVLYIFENDESIRLKWQTRLEYIMIDEFQDIDTIQYKLMEVLCDFHHNLFVVGDPDQTIYTWRGADIRFLMDFDKKFPDVKTILMNENYRSTPEIIACANSLVSKNKNRLSKNLVSQQPASEKPIYHHAKTSFDEALWICDYIKKITQNGESCSDSLSDKKTCLSDIAILYRAHYISRIIEDVLNDQKIPFTLYSGISFFEREEIKDALCYLRMIAYHDDLSFRRIVNKPRRNIGQTRIKILETYSQENKCSLYDSLCFLSETSDFSSTKTKDFINLISRFSGSPTSSSISELLGHVLDLSGYEKLLRTEGCQDRLDNLAELKQSIFEFETSCGEDCDLLYYLNHVSIMSSLDASPSKNAVKLMTVHTAKGLEFPHVILCGMNEGIFPSKKVQTKSQMEEERRIAFVAITRAKKTLTITEAQGRNLDGSVRFPSRFIFDIDKSLMNYTQPIDDNLSNAALESIKISENILENTELAQLFSESDVIRHPILGVGVIKSIDFDKKAYLIKFAELTTPRSISFRVRLLKENTEKTEN